MVDKMATSGCRSESPNAITLSDNQMFQSNVDPGEDPSLARLGPITTPLVVMEEVEGRKDRAS